MESSKIDEFVSKLISENIILETTETKFETVVLPEDYQRVEWATPVLLVFNDLADLLLIDPIHDTSLDGWPMKKNE
jgi:hypothetical protein